MIIEYAKNPVRISETQINLFVKFQEFNEELEFTATPDDSEPHGRELYQRALAGEFGEIA